MISPDFKYYIDSYSNISTPKCVELYTINGNFKSVIGIKKINKSNNYKLGKAEIFRIPAEGGVMLPAKWILPPNFDKNKKYPVLISIYGGPDAATVYNTYNRSSNYYFAQEGIITLSVDHRGSGHFGKRMNVLLHRNLGDWEIKDYISAVKWLRTKTFIDSKKIGIRGGSYGGYITCMALTKGADYFTHGIASSSVTDWKFYDSIYTERYMDTPIENPKGYENGSVLKYANKLKGVLYIVHGEMDDNVHLQNSIQLLSKLEDLDKDFMFMLYPDGRHGWRGKKRVHSTRQSVKFWFKYLLGKKFDGKIM
jgi:dipeptidyl-peptidase-4